MDSSFGNHDCSSRRLEVAILNGDVDDMEDVLRRIPDLTDRRKKSLFEAAVYTSNRDVILCLLRHGILPKEESSIFNSIQQVQNFKALIADCSGLTSSSGKRLLHVAVSANPRLIPLLVETGCDVNARDLVRGNTPLHVACIQCQQAAALALVRAGARVNELNDGLQTPLYVLLKSAHAARKSAFHAKSRQNLALILIRMGFQLVTSQEIGDLQRDKHFYRVSDLHRRLLRATCHVPTLQHLCRVEIRRACEVTGKVRGQNMQQVLQQLEVSRCLVNYLSFQQLLGDPQQLRAGDQGKRAAIQTAVHFG